MSVAEFEILYDETIELLDGNNENILLRMMRVGFQNKKSVRTVLFDSKERFYVLYSRLKYETNKISSFYYSSDSKLLYKYWPCDIGVMQIIDYSHDKIVQSYGFTGSIIVNYFYENRHEYWPTSGLSNIILK